MGWRSDKIPKNAGAASPFGSGELKRLSFPPVAVALPYRDFVDQLSRLFHGFIPLIAIVFRYKNSFQKILRILDLCFGMGLPGSQNTDGQ